MRSMRTVITIFLPTIFIAIKIGYIAFALLMKLGTSHTCIANGIGYKYICMTNRIWWSCCQPGWINVSCFIYCQSAWLMLLSNVFMMWSVEVDLNDICKCMLVRLWYQLMFLYFCNCLWNLYKDLIISVIVYFYTCFVL